MVGTHVAAVVVVVVVVVVDVVVVEVVVVYADLTIRAARVPSLACNSRSCL